MIGGEDAIVRRLDPAFVALAPSTEEAPRTPGRKDVGGSTADAETAPLRRTENCPCDLNLADIAEVWRRGSVIASWLLDLAAAALLKSPELENFATVSRIRARNAGRSLRRSTS